ncbi:MAG: SLBB domain-containing protein [Calditrichae bacterium]|nr:SLBB domain-containing protein [Calditrichota bacterium]MCB9058427.1 SLBB domain-containing protein [Calditrichia bacterium]
MPKNLLYPLVLIVLVFAAKSNAEQLIPGDGVRLTFYNISQEITGDYFIDENGIIQFPYIGFINTKDKDYRVIKQQVEAKYDSLYRGVELIIAPLYRISVLGEVGNPGVYFTTGVEKVLDVIAMAGGETEDSDLNEVLINRNGEIIVFDAEESFENEVNDFYLKSGDRVFVTRKWWVTGQNTTFLFTAAGLIVTIYAVLSR